VNRISFLEKSQLLTATMEVDGSNPSRGGTDPSHEDATSSRRGGNDPSNEMYVAWTSRGVNDSSRRGVATAEMSPLPSTSG
jgi:hypothetical protein